MVLYFFFFDYNVVGILSQYDIISTRLLLRIAEGCRRQTIDVLFEIETSEYVTNAAILVDAHEPFLVRYGGYIGFITFRISLGYHLSYIKI